jgi:hypothetical protein
MKKQEKLKKKKNHVNLEPQDNGLEESHNIIRSMIANRDASHEELHAALDSLNKEPDSELTNSLRDALHTEIKRRQAEVAAHGERMKTAIEAKKQEAAVQKKKHEDDIDFKATATKKMDQSSPDFKEIGYNERNLHYRNQFEYHRLGKLQKAIDKVQWKTTDEGKQKEAANVAKEYDHLHPHIAKEYQLAQIFDHTDPEKVKHAQHTFPFLAGKSPSALKSHFDKVKKSYYHQVVVDQYNEQYKKRSQFYKNAKIQKARPRTIEILTKRAEAKQPLGRKLFSFVKKVASNVGKKDMTEEVNSPDGQAGNPYYLHVLYGKKGEKGTDDYKTEILKIKSQDAQNHPDEKTIHKTISDHPISKLHAVNGYNYMYAIGSPHDSPMRSQELMSLLQRGNKDQEHKTKIWEEVAQELTEDVILAVHKKLANRK